MGVVLPFEPGSYGVHCIDNCESAMVVVVLCDRCVLRGARKSSRSIMLDLSSRGLELAYVDSSETVDWVGWL